MNALDKQLCRGPTHFVERLTNCGEPRIEVFSDDDVVKANHGDVGWAIEAGVFDCTNGSDGGRIVETEDGGEVTGAGEQIANRRIAKLGRPYIFFEEDAEFGSDDEADLLCDGYDGLPTGF